ncbi:MAG: GAK system XXXCH domain-containing protein [Desulfobulbaceae bacterium]|nr:GAK system XXXCH domain-containing protein [Desulfobulbaceae bacterium]
MSALSRVQFAEQKFRPLKKEMQRTFSRIKRSLQADIWPERRDVVEFMEQARVMISYPGFHDEAYQEFLSAVEAMVAAHAAGERDDAQDALRLILILQNRCHQGR